MGGGSVGIVEIDKLENITLYPNPASNNLTITFNESHSNAYSLEIFNNLGKKVMSSENIKNKQVINIENLSEGIYSVKINATNGLYKVWKVIKINY